MRLRKGQRFLLEDGNTFARVEAGRVEVYLTTRDEGSFRQEYLFLREGGQAVFPLEEISEDIAIRLYAVTDTELSLLPHGGLSAGELAPLMAEWLFALSGCPPVVRMRNLGDDVLRKWYEGTAIPSDAPSAEKLWEHFRFNQDVFSTLCYTRFAAKENLFRVQAMRSSQYKERLADEATGNLLGEMAFMHASEAAELTNSKEAAFIVRRIAQFLSLPADDVRLPADIAKRMGRSAVLRRLIHNAGMAFRKAKLEKGWQNGDCGAMIGYYGAGKQMCALLPDGAESYRMVTLQNPRGGKVSREMADRMDENVLVCYAGFPSRKLKIRDLLRFMFRSAWRNDYRTILAASFFGALIPLLLPIIMETIFSDIIPAHNRQDLAMVAQVMLMAGFASAALSLMRSIAVMRIGSHIDMAAEAALWHRLLSLPTDFFRRYQAGALLSRMRSLESFKQFMGGQYIGGILDLGFSFWSLLLMCYYSMKLTLAALVLWGIFFIVTAVIYRPLLRYNRNLVEAANRNQGQVQQIFSGLAKFRIHGAEPQAYYLWSKSYGEEWKWSLALRRQGNWNAVLGAVQPLIMMLFLYYLVMYQFTEVVNGVTYHVVDYATFIAFSAAYGMLNAALVSVVPYVVQVLSARPHFENLRPIMEAEPEWAEDKADVDVLTGSIEVRHLSFSYVPGQEVLRDISFDIPAGASVAIVGTSGSGKSTLLRLMLGFEAPSRGAIYYDGQDLAGLSAASVRAQMGVVLQSGQLMTGDIFSNIVGVSPLNMEDAWAAARAAGIEDDIRAMPMGMMTMISEGSSNISGGQRQRILIARAIAARPPIMIFDEATSALDNHAQSIVMESLSKLRSTRIIVAHRLSTIRNVDRILVLDGGRIAESGSFDELMARGGIFAELVERQMT